VRLLDVTISSDLSLERHVSGTCSTCFCWLRQIRRIRRSHDTESTKTFVHAFIASCVDYCNTVLVATGALKMQDRRMQDLKMRDQIAGHENAGPENEGPNRRA